MIACCVRDLTASSLPCWNSMRFVNDWQARSPPYTHLLCPRGARLCIVSMPPPPPPLLLRPHHAAVPSTRCSPTRSSLRQRVLCRFNSSQRHSKNEESCEASLISWLLLRSDLHVSSRTSDALALPNRHHSRTGNTTHVYNQGL